MKNLILFLIIFLLSLVASAQFTDAQKQYLDAENLLKNPGFEQGLSNVTKSGSSVLAQVTSGVNLIKGKASASWDAANNTETLSTKQYTVPQRLKGQNCQAGFWAKGGDANLIFEVLDGSSNVLVSQTLSVSTIALPMTLNFPCPSSSTIGMRWRATADAAIMYLDTLWLGEPTNLYQLSQATMYGGAKWLNTGSCTWNHNNAAFGYFAADTDCTTPTGTNLYGKGEAPATKIPAVKFTNLPPGDYLVIMQGGFYFGGTGASSPSVSLRMTDGSIISSAMALNGYCNGCTTINYPSTSFQGRFSYTTTQAEVNFQPQSAETGTSSGMYLDAASSGAHFEILVYRFPSSTEQAYRPDVANWLVDANIYGTSSNNALLGSTSISSYTEISDGAFAIQQNANSIDVQIPCATTNPSNGLTCSSSAESIGVVFTVPRAGKVEVCGSFTNSIDTAINGGCSNTFRWMETPNNAQTILQEGAESSNSYKYTPPTDNSGHIAGYPHKNCSIFNFTSAGKKTLRLMYEVSVGGNGCGSENSIFLSRNTASGQPDMHITARPIDQAVPAPLLVNSVVSDYAGITKINSIRLDGTNSCAVSGETGDWINGTPSHTGTGVCSATFNSGIFSAVAICYCTIQGTNIGRGCILDSDSLGFLVKTFDSTATAVDTYVHVFCIGAR